MTFIIKKHYMNCAGWMCLLFACVCGRRFQRRLLLSAKVAKPLIALASAGELRIPD